MAVARPLSAASWVALSRSCDALLEAVPALSAAGRRRDARAPVPRHSGPANAQALLRTFDETSEEAVRIVLYRDRHAWCPYCQKVWMQLEEKRIPYRVEKINMRCYGKKSRAYQRLVPSGMLPALELDGDRLGAEHDGGRSLGGSQTIRRFHRPRSRPPSRRLRHLICWR